MQYKEVRALVVKWAMDIGLSRGKADYTFETLVATSFNSYPNDETVRSAIEQFFDPEHINQGVVFVRLIEQSRRNHDARTTAIEEWSTTNNREPSLYAIVFDESIEVIINELGAESRITEDGRHCISDQGLDVWCFPKSSLEEVRSVVDFVINEDGTANLKK